MPPWTPVAAAQHLGLPNPPPPARGCHLLTDTFYSRLWAEELTLGRERAFLALYPCRVSLDSNNYD